jgi:hypothetical protein
MISLYDYLGHAAGSTLGKQVAEYAKLRNARFGSRHVSNKVYNGIVHLYEESLLKEFFETKKILTNA